VFSPPTQRRRVHVAVRALSRVADRFGPLAHLISCSCAHQPFRQTVAVALHSGVVALASHSHCRSSGISQCWKEPTFDSNWQLQLQLELRATPPHLPATTASALKPDSDSHQPHLILSRYTSRRSPLIDQIANLADRNTDFYPLLFTAPR
jgi:hypothetical protein